MARRFIGIDNGLSGGICSIREDQQLHSLQTIPIIKISGKKEYDIRAIIEHFKWLKKGNELYAVLEKAHVRPISGKRACFMNGGGYFLMRTALIALDIPHEIVTPQSWQKELLSGLKNKDTKQASIAFCKRRWPMINLTATERSKKDHDGLADALCMALYCYRLNR